MMTTGYDCPDILNVALMRPVFSPADFVQMKGRGTRKANFKYIHSLLSAYNKKELFQNFSDDCVPMVYPFVYENKELLEHLKENKIYTGRWWTSVLNRVEPTSLEASLSQFMLPIPIDQRYGKEEIDLIVKLIVNKINI